MNDILEELSAMRRVDAARRELEISFDEMMRRASEAPKARDFKAALSTARNARSRNVIAELKRASPSEGMIRDVFRPAGLAPKLAESGAAALSVLCEPHRFLGSEDYLREAREAVGIPVLYKDFITTRYQLAAARAAGADAALLIAAVLPQGELAGLVSFARSIGLEPLVETHDADEISRAVDAGAETIGVNCRNLRDFSTDVSLLERLIGKIPASCVRVAESGMHTPGDIARAASAGADAFLVGTALMRSADPGVALSRMISESQNQN